MEQDIITTNSEKLELYYRTGDIRLRNEIVLANADLVWYIVKGYSSGIATREDMFQAGVVGLITAIDRFQPSKGVRLSTYAVPYIRNEIRRLIDNPDYIEDHVGLEATDTSEENVLQKKLAELYDAVLEPKERTILDIILRTNDEPAWSVNDIAKETGLTGKQVRELYASGVVKMSQPWVSWYIKLLRETL